MSASLRPGRRSDAHLLPDEEGPAARLGTRGYKTLKQIFDFDTLFVLKTF